jgi:hypothetical protein
MRRREFIGALVLEPLATQSSAAEKRISILYSGFPERTPNASRARRSRRRIEMYAAHRRMIECVAFFNC